MKKIKSKFVYLNYLYSTEQEQNRTQTSNIYIQQM